MTKILLCSLVVQSALGLSPFPVHHPVAIPRRPKIAACDPTSPEDIGIDVEGVPRASVVEASSASAAASEAVAERRDSASDLGDFNELLLSPARATEEEFVSGLENYTKTHGAVTHRLLADLAGASYGREGTADALLRFLSAYARFNSKFIDNIRTLLNLLDNEHHIDILEENLEEEMGEYDAETLEACEAMGIPRASIDGVPHGELFQKLVEFVEAALGRSYGASVPDRVCEALNLAVDHARERGRLGLLAALYFGSELIVPQIYSSILRGLRKTIEPTNEEAKFLILHIDMDQDHAALLREIILDSCRTREDRLVLFECTNRLLVGRVAFYDALVEHSSQLDDEGKGTFYVDHATGARVRSRLNCTGDFGSASLGVGCGEDANESHSAIPTGIVGISGDDARCD